MNTRKVRRGNNAGMAQITAVIFITIAALVIHGGCHAPA
jgi:hypothetical protein